MPTQCSTKPLEFEGHGSRRVVADFDGGMPESPHRRVIAIACWQALLDIRVINGAHRFPISGKIIATIPWISKAGNRACRSMDAPAFSLSGRRARLLWCRWVGFDREAEGRAPLKRGGGAHPQRGFWIFHR